MAGSSPTSIQSAIAATRQAVVSDLERRAKTAKDADGDLDQALAWLQHAKRIEDAADAAASAATSPNGVGDDPLSLQLKRLAVHCKQRGDIPAAREFLSRSKQLEELRARQRREEEEGGRDEEKERTTGTEEGARRATEEVIVVEEEGGDEGVEDGADSTSEYSAHEDEGDAADEDAGITFTDEEMMDEEIMMELFLMGMEVPSQDDYSDRILVHKKRALEMKRKGDVPGASSQLRTAKQLEAVREKLQQSKEGLGLRVNHDEEDWIEKLDQNESALLEESFRQNSSEIELEDLEDMGDEDLREVVAMGMTLPSPEDLRRTGTEKQKEALAYKQAGNVEMAKVMLVESKKYKIQADRLEEIAQSDGKEDQELSEDDLMALLSGGERSNGRSKKEQQQQQESSSTKEQPPPLEKDPWFHKPSAEIKTELLRVKNEKNLVEAKRLLGIYKRVLEKESKAKEAARRKQLLEQIQAQLEIADTQMRLFSFYQRFVNDQVGTEQLLRWNDYKDVCIETIRRIDDDGSAVVDSVSIDKDTKLLILKEDDVAGIVESGTASSSSPLSGVLEVSVLEVMNLHENKAMQKFMTKQREQLKGQCPLIEVNVKMPQQPNFIFHPSSSVDRSQVDTGEDGDSVGTTPSFQYLFTESQSIDLPRGDSRAAKLVLGKLENKKVQISVVAKVPPPPAEEESSIWSFFSSSPAPKSPEQTTSAAEDATALLGKVTIELKGLLKRNCIAGDFPMVLNSKEYGGSVRVCLRTDEPFDLSQFQSLPYDATLMRHSSAVRPLLLV